MRKNDFEERLSFMVAAYQKEKETLDLMEEGSADYLKQKAKCDKLFANTERFVHANWASQPKVAILQWIAFNKIFNQIIGNDLIANITNGWPHLTH